MKYVLGRLAHDGGRASCSKELAISSKRESGIVHGVLEGSPQSQSFVSRPLFDGAGL